MPHTRNTGDRRDPLRAFKSWDGSELGGTTEDPYGFHGEIETPANLLGIAGAWVISTELSRGQPGVYLRFVARSRGHVDHVLEAVFHADVARELATALYAGAERAPLDQAARDLEAEGLL